jgi:hypothetical protein
MKVLDLSGQVFGALTVLRKDEEATKKNKRGTYWCKCSECNNEKLISSNIFRGRKPVVSCGCRKAAGHTHPKARPDKGWEKKLYWYARRNSRRRGEECTLELDDIYIPEFCPVLGIRLQPGSHTHQDNSPSVDRIDSTKGYTKDNVWIISARANRIKNNSTIEEIGMLYEALKSLTKN